MQGNGYLSFEISKFLRFNILFLYRHIYVVDLFDHNVHVLERKEDNGLVTVKVNDSKCHRYESALISYGTFQ